MTDLIAMEENANESKLLRMWRMEFWQTIKIYSESYNHTQMCTIADLTHPPKNQHKQNTKKQFYSLINYKKWNYNTGLTCTTYYLIIVLTNNVNVIVFDLY
jgi:hypothetical protein